MKSLYFLLALTGLAPLLLPAQNLENLPRATPVQLTGSLRFGTQFYQVSGIGERAAPFQFTAGGRLNLRILEEFNVPISFAIGRQRPTLRFPVYRQFGISPRYKWITLHAGYRNMQLSRFSLNNHTFLGGGIELEPGKFRLGAMYGRLRQGARELNGGIDLLFGQPLYNRFAHGGRIGYGTVESHFDLVYFRAEDRDANVDLDPELRVPPPAENIVVGFEWRQRIGRWINLHAEAAASGYNRDRNSEPFPTGDFPGKEVLESIFTPRFSAQAGLAYRGGVTYRAAAFNAGVDYERIDPGFESMGTYFLNGDWENVRASLGFGLFKNKLLVQSSLGRQRNNLFEQRVETSRRTIGSVNATLRGNERWNLSANYANYQQEHRPSVQVVLNDTLRIAQTTENLGGSWTLSGKGGEGRPRGTFTATVNRQVSSNDNPLGEGFDALTSLFGSLNYGYQLANATTFLNLATNYSTVDVAGRQTQAFGGTVGVRQQLWDKKLRLSLTNTYNQNRVDGRSDGFSNALRITGGWRLSKLHQVSLAASWIERESQAGFGFTERRGTLTYGLTLPTLKSKKRQP